MAVLWSRHAGQPERFLCLATAWPDDHRQALLREVREIHRQKRGSYGSRRMAKALRHRGYEVGRYQARRLMREAGVEARQRRRWRHTTDSQHTLPVAPNPAKPPIHGGGAEPGLGWPISRPSGRWKGGSIWRRCSTSTTGSWWAGRWRTTCARSWFWTPGDGRRRRQPKSGLIHHSDRGSQYASHDYRSTLDRHGFQASMSRKGNCWDNAVMERFFGSLKSEWLADQRYGTRQAARRDVVEYIEMEYNSCRLHSTSATSHRGRSNWQLRLENVSALT